MLVRQCLRVVWHARGACMKNNGETVFKTECNDQRRALGFTLRTKFNLPGEMLLSSGPLFLTHITTYQSSIFSPLMRILAHTHMP